MSPAKAVVLFIGDSKLAGVPKYLPRIVFPCDNQDLEALPAKRPELINVLVYIFIPIKSTYYSVYLELDTIFLAPRSNLVQLRDLIAGSTANLDVGRLVKGIARDR